MAEWNLAEESSSIDLNGTETGTVRQVAAGDSHRMELTTFLGDGPELKEVQECDCEV